MNFIKSKGLGYVAAGDLIRTYFWVRSHGDIRIGRHHRLWPRICPSNQDGDDPRLSPLTKSGPGLKGLGCKRVLVGVSVTEEVHETQG